jgi:hypothetical protein
MAPAFTGNARLLVFPATTGVPVLSTANALTLVAADTYVPSPYMLESR